MLPLVMPTRNCVLKHNYVITIIFYVIVRCSLCRKTEIIAKTSIVETNKETIITNV